MILNGKKPYDKLKEPSPNSKIWRYMDSLKFFDLLSKSKLFFVRLDKLSDKFEGILTSNCQDEIRSRLENPDFHMSRKEIEYHTNKEIQIIENFRKYTLVNCWSQNTHESYALWKIYLGNQPYGISIETTYQNLKDSLIDTNFNFVLQKVHYSDKVKELKQQCVNFRKNKFYKFENEVRIAIFSQYMEFNREPKFEIGTFINVDLRKLIKKVYISPFSPEWYFDLVNYMVFDKFNYSFPIVKSKIMDI
jgi:hypothetical protein